MLLEASRIARFGLVGIAATGCHAAVYSLLSGPMSIPAMQANVLGYLAALTVSYGGQQFLTFHDRRRSWGGAARFLATSLALLALNCLWVLLFVDVMQWPTPTALIGIAGLTPVVSYLALRTWVFRTPRR